MSRRTIHPAIRAAYPRDFEHMKELAKEIARSGACGHAVSEGHAHARQRADHAAKGHTNPAKARRYFESEFFSEFAREMRKHPCKARGRRSAR